ncbi:unnamed protein product [Arctogadus glacialis]
MYVWMSRERAECCPLSPRSRRAGAPTGGGGDPGGKPEQDPLNQLVEGAGGSFITHGVLLRTNTSQYPVTVTFPSRTWGGVLGHSIMRKGGWPTNSGTLSSRSSTCSVIPRHPSAGPRCVADAPAGTPLDLGNAKNPPPPSPATLLPPLPPTAPPHLHQLSAAQRSGPQISPDKPLGRPAA